MIQDAQLDRIHTLEISEPELACDGVRFITLYSPALQGRGDVSVFVPPGIENSKSVPVVLLLHGVYGSHWAWFFKGAAHRTAASLISSGQVRPMLLVAPSDGLYQDGSGYLPHSGRDDEAWITQDVVEAIRRSFPCVDPDSRFFIAGLSMGGYGALRLGAKHAGFFSGISAHSSITNLDEMQSFVFQPFQANEIDPLEGNLLHWMERNRATLPPLRFDCGTGDQLLENNRKFHRELERRQLPHQYFEFEGEHHWPYWRSHLADTLLFFEAILSEGKPGTTMGQCERGHSPDAQLP